MSLPTRIEISKRNPGLYQTYFAEYFLDNRRTYSTNGQDSRLEDLAKILAIETDRHPVKSRRGIESPGDIEINGETYVQITDSERRTFYRYYQKEIEKRMSLHQSS